MTEAETAVREALAKMTLGEWIAIDDGVCVVDDSKWDSHGLRTLGSFRSRANAAGIVALRNRTPALLAELDAARAEVARLRRCLLPVSMGLAYAELAKGEPVADDAVVLSFNGGGGSDFVTAGEIRAALEPRP